MRGIPLTLGALTALLIATIGLTEPPVLWLIGLPVVVAMVVAGRWFDRRLDRPSEPLSAGSLFAMTAVFITVPLVILRGMEGAAYLFPALGVAAGVGVFLYFRRLARQHQSGVGGVQVPQ